MPAPYRHHTAAPLVTSTVDPLAAAHRTKVLGGAAFATLPGLVDEHGSNAPVDTGALLDGSEVAPTTNHHD